MTYAVDPELVPWVAMLQQASYSEHEQARADQAALLGHRPPYDPATSLGSGKLRRSAPKALLRSPCAFSPLPVAVPASACPASCCRGGGFVFGSVDALDCDAARIADQVGAVVVCVDTGWPPNTASRPDLRTATPR